MRISDWSSDVCSSDLSYGSVTDVALSFGSATRRCRERILASCGGRNLVGTSVSKTRDFTGDENGVNSGASTEAAEPISRTPEIERLRMFSRIAQAVAGDFDLSELVTMVTRSEETTSELQSLMRISY